MKVALPVVRGLHGSRIEGTTRRFKVGDFKTEFNGLGVLRTDIRTVPDRLIHFPRLEGPATGQDAPGNAGEFVGKGDCLGIPKVILLSVGIGTNILRRHQPGSMAKAIELAAEMMRADTSLHANQAWRQVGKACFHLAT